jgi:hypothetical protein
MCLLLLGICNWQLTIGNRQKFDACQLHIAYCLFDSSALRGPDEHNLISRT